MRQTTGIVDEGYYVQSELGWEVPKEITFDARRDDIIGVNERLDWTYREKFGEKRVFRGNAQ